MCNEGFIFILCINIFQNPVRNNPVKHWNKDLNRHLDKEDGK